MRNKGEQTRRGVGGAMPPVAFQGLGLSMDAALFKAARMSARPAGPRAGAPSACPPDPAAPWGVKLLVTLGRYTRAG